MLILPGIMAVVVPLIVGIFFGYWSIRWFCLLGALVTGVMMAIFMSNAGGSWDNAKNILKKAVMAEKGSDAHKAAVVGDTVGDPFKEILLALLSIF